MTRIEWKVRERQATRDAVVTSISSQYSDVQQIAGPLLWLRCSEARSTTRLDEKGQRHIEQEQIEPGDHERFSHYVPKNKILESAISGKPVKALCGKKWLPGRDPEKFPVCPTCKAIYEKMKNT